MQVGMNGHKVTIGWKTITTVLLGVGLLSDALLKGGILWARVGWETPNGHDADYSALGTFRDEWRCDELEEELSDLLLAADIGTTTALQNQRISRLNELVGVSNLNCARFED